MRAILIGLTLSACSAAQDVQPIHDGPIFEADQVAASMPWEDPGFDVARAALTDATDLDEPTNPDWREHLPPSTPQCDRVAYLGLRWFDEDTRFQGRFYALDGQPLAKTRGFFAPVGDDGGTFTGRWSSPAPAGTPRRAGPLGGLYYSDHSFEGQATYDGIPFEVTGGWVRTHSQGGIALAIVEHCE